MFKFLRMKLFFSLLVQLRLYVPRGFEKEEVMDHPGWWFAKEDRHPLMKALMKARDDGRMNLLQRLIFWFVGGERYGVITGREIITQFKTSPNYIINAYVDENGRKVRFFKRIATTIDAGYIQVIEDILNKVVTKATVDIVPYKDGYKYTIKSPELPRNGRRVLQGVLNNPKQYEVLLVTKSNVFDLKVELYSLHHSRLHNHVDVESDIGDHARLTTSY